MRRFVRSFFVRRKAQVTVIQDGEARQFEVWLWTAAGNAMTMIHHYPYAPGASAVVKGIAVKAAAARADAEKGRPS